MPEKPLYRNARDVILSLFTSRRDIDDDAAGAAVGVAEAKPVRGAWQRSGPSDLVGQFRLLGSTNERDKTDPRTR
jgi:hypothetical protein